MTAAVSPQASDQGQLPRLLDAVKSHYGHTPDCLLADAGYRNERDLRELGPRGIDGYVALGREGRPAAGALKLHTPGVGTLMPSANGWWKHTSAGSNASWAFANSACAGLAPGPGANGIWHVWP